MARSLRALGPSRWGFGRRRSGWGVQGVEVRERRDLRDKLSGFLRTHPYVIGDKIRWVRGTKENMKGGLRKEVTLGTSVVNCNTNAIFASRLVNQLSAPWFGAVSTLELAVPV
jgi:hypothetical protein